MLTNYSYSAIRAFARKYYPPGTVLLLTPTAYQIELGAVAANSQASGALQVNSNADFVFCGINYATGMFAYSTISGNLNLVDTSSGYSLMSGSVDLPSIANFVGGIDVRPLPYPYFMSANSSMTAQYADNGFGAVTNLCLSFVGFHIREYR